MTAIELNRSPVYPEQEYVWFAEYEDGHRVYEYDNDKKETMFDYLDKNGIASFGLIGNGLKMYYKSKNGKFNLAGKIFHPTITREDGSVLNIKDIKDIISFKMAHTDGVFLGNKLKRYERHLDGYFFGYKFNTEGLYLQVIMGIPVAGEDRRPFIGIKITPSKRDETISIINLNEQKEKMVLKKGRSSALTMFF